MLVHYLAESSGQLRKYAALCMAQLALCMGGQLALLENNALAAIVSLLRVRCVRASDHSDSLVSVPLPFFQDPLPNVVSAGARHSFPLLHACVLTVPQPATVY